MLGESAFTTLTNEGIPLIRYKTKDLASIDHTVCECGRSSTGISKFKGRVDDMLIIRGVNVFPSRIEEVILGIDELGLHCEIILKKTDISTG